MSWDSPVVSALREGDVELVVYLPDSFLSPLLDRIEDQEDFETVAVAREEEAIGILAGAWLGGRRGALVCQSSGLSNTFNALASFSKPWGLPFLGLVTRRGDLGEHNLAQVPAGYAMPRLLDTIGIRNRTLDGSEDLERQVGMGIDTAFTTQTPYVFLLDATMERPA